jgi:hypothetical protein
VGVTSPVQGGALVASLSASDLRGLLPQHMGALALPVLRFLSARACTPSSWLAAAHQPGNEWGLRGAEELRAPQPLTCAPGATLGQVRGGGGGSWALEEGLLQPGRGAPALAWGQPGAAGAGVFACRLPDQVGAGGLKAAGARGRWLAGWH